MIGKKRDDAAYVEFVAARQQHLFRVAYAVCGDWHQAGDLLQTALAKLYVAWPRVSRMKATDTYVRRMLVTANIDRSRRPWHRETPGVDGFDQPAREVDLDAQHDLAVALGSLARGQRQVVVLRHLWGLSVDETAAELGISPGTVKSQTSNALSRLRDALAPATGKEQQA